MGQTKKRNYDRYTEHPGIKWAPNSNKREEVKNATDVSSREQEKN